MAITIGYLKSENQFLTATLNQSTQSFEKKTLDIVEIKETPLNLLIIDQALDLSGLAHTLEGEKKFYPIIQSNEAQMDLNLFDIASYQEFAGIYSKAATRWILNNNIHLIENFTSTVNHLKNLWLRDRNSFFEELWFVLKTNLATHHLTLVFNDLKEPENKDKDKPSLVQNFVTGEKIPQTFEGSGKESELMKSYQKDFGAPFDITDYSGNTGKLVATSQIDMSPILIMAEISSMNQLQSSILKGLFNGLQSEN